MIADAAEGVAVARHGIIPRLDLIMERSLPNRWTLAAAAVLMQVCLGIIYAWSVFRGPLSQAYGWDKTVTIAPYRWSTLFFTIAMVIAGFWQDKKGPRVVGTVGGLLLGTGCLLASMFGHTPMGLVLSYGVVAGLGVGFAYVTPIATCVKWFPDKRGMVVGLAVMGFGIGSLVFAPLLEVLMGSDPAKFTETIPRTFLILSGLFFVLVTGAAQMYQVPPPGWKPEGWNPPAASGARRADYSAAEMLGTWQFYPVWAMYFIGSAIGLTAIGEAAPLIRERGATGMIMSAAAALGVMAVFNGAGRLGWGSLSDRIGRTRAILGMCGLYAVACAVLLPSATTFWPVLAGICLIGFCYGGYLAILPSLTADYWGSKNIGANYGIVFSAWGAAGFVVPGYFAAIIERSKQAGQLGAGYTQVFHSLAAMAAVCAVVALACRRPVK
ncbi:MAG: OFA family MFS transporter [Acidobacteria bacterium]|nr:OFA family MFS transporter [Acidobacteriota bacterium]